jgi:hypothetical protein
VQCSGIDQLPQNKDLFYLHYWNLFDILKHHHLNWKYKYFIISWLKIM